MHKQFDKKKVSSNKSNSNLLSAQLVLETLEPEYGPFIWKSRYDPIHEMVFTILTQHTSDLNAEKAFENLMKKFGSLENVARSNVKSIAQAINRGGLSNIKAPRIKEILNLIVDKVGNLDLNFLKDMSLDDAKSFLIQLPGIGPKSAAVILCLSLGMPAMPVDTHVFRVAKRLGLIDHKTDVNKAHSILESAIAPKDVYGFHVALITHGRNICKAIRPLCGQCVLANYCPSSRLSI